MRHFVFGLVILAVTGTLFQGVNGIACLSCKRGLTDYESGLSECSHIEECEPDQVCFVEKFISETDPTKPKYRAGCRAVKDCKLISCSNAVTETIPTHAPHVGKRAGDEIPLCSECCYSDMCNVNGCNTTALEAERVKYHKRCFSCSKIVPEDASTCTDMKWCDQPSQVCSITADPVRKQYNLGCEEESICNATLQAHETNGAPLLLKCFDGHLKNFNPVSNHTDTFVADVLKCPTALVPANVTTAAPSTQASTSKRQTTTAIPPPSSTTTTTTQTSTTSTTTAPSTSAKTFPTTTTPAPTPPIVTTTTTMATSTPTSTTQSTTQTPLPTLRTVKSTTPLAPTLPPRTSTSTLVPTSPDTNSPSLPTIPIITAIVTMAPTSQTTTTTTVDTTTSPDTTTSRPSTTITTPAATTSTPTTTTTQPPSTPTTTSTTTTTTTAKPPTTPPPPTTTTPTTTPTTTTPTTTPTTTTPTTTTPPTTTPTTTTPTTKTPTTTIRTTTNPPPPAGHTIAPNPTTCFVCIDDEPEMCDILYAETTCEPPNNYCINQVTNLASGDKLVNRTCGNFDRCFKDWYHGSSDKDVCQNFDENQYITLDFECVYCCVQDRCNEFMKPPIDTLYEDK